MQTQEANAALERIKQEIPLEMRQLVTEVIKFHLAMSSFNISAGGQVSELNCTAEQHNQDLIESFDSLFIEDNN